MASGVEVEVKFQISLVQVISLRAKLERLGGIPVSFFERNILFDDKKKTLRKRGCILRLREEFSPKRPNSLNRSLTLKEDVTQSQFLKRKEIPVHLNEDLFGLITILLNLFGLREVFVYEKDREDWFGFNASIYIGEIPYFGYFLEIEGGEEKIAAMVKKLGLDIKDSLKDDYRTLWEKESKKRKLKIDRLTRER